jgi:MFS family permease
MVLPISRSRAPDFNLFWAGQSVSLVGSQITTLALPLTAVLTLGAGAAELGGLQAARSIPFLLLTLPVGILADRMRRRPLLIGADLGRAAAIATIPLAAVLGALNMEILYVIAFVAGALTVVFDVAYVAVVPSLVRSEDLVSANSKLLASSSIAEVGGPAIAGQLVHALGAPFAMLADAASFAFGGLSIALIRQRESAPPAGGERAIGEELREGLAAAFGNPYVRAIGAMAATYNLIETAILTLLIPFVIRELGFDPATLGLVLGTGAIGALVGALLAGWLARRIGVGRAIVAAMLVECCAFVPVASLHGATLGTAGVLALGLFANGFGLAVSNVHSMSVRQSVTAPGLLGRMNAGYRFLVSGAVPLGALAGGFLGEAIGLRPSLLYLSLALPLSVLWVAASPLPRLRALRGIS